VLSLRCLAAFETINYAMLMRYVNFIYILNLQLYSGHAVGHIVDRRVVCIGVRQLFNLLNVYNVYFETKMFVTA
jgi:hypothetical protein